MTRDEVNARFDRVDAKFDKLEDALRAGFDRLSRRLTPVLPSSW